MRHKLTRSHGCSGQLCLQLYLYSLCSGVVVLGLCFERETKVGCGAEPRPSELADVFSIGQSCLYLDETMEKEAHQDVLLTHESLVRGLLTAEAPSHDNQTEF